MTRQLYVKEGKRREMALVEDGHLVEYLRENPAEQTTGAVCLGRVERIVPGMNAAFVDVGQEKNGFLPLSEPNLPDVEKLQTGMAVLVQIKKEAQGSKGPFLLRDISLCAEHVLLMPLNKKIGISARVQDDGKRDELREMGERISQGQYGLVMRSSAAEAEEADIREEVAALMEQWEHIRRTAPTAHVPSVVLPSQSLLLGLLDDYRAKGLDRIDTDSRELYPTLSAYAPTTLCDRDPIASQGSLAVQREKVLERRVRLDSGGTLIFDQCEAMTVIDVNTARFTGRHEPEETFLRLNLEACEEIARQVRLRNIAGIILIDMIDMESEENRVKVLEALRQAFAPDRVKTVIHGFTSLGLIEMTRKRSRRPLRDDWTKPCEACHGKGFVKEENDG